MQAFFLKKYIFVAIWQFFRYNERVSRSAFSVSTNHIHYNYGQKRGLIVIKTVIFDLDGTLTDTLGDLATAVNFVLEKNALPTHEVEEYKYFVGWGSYVLLKKASPEGTSEEKLQEMLSDFFEYYNEHYLDKTVPYEGINEMLATLRKRGIRLAVCSNKIQNMTEKVCDRFFEGVFEYTFGQNEKFPLKPDPACPIWIAEQFGADPSEVFFVGDSGSDMKTAKNGGFTAVGVSWGFRPREELLENGADYIVDKAEELIKLTEKV